MRRRAIACLALLGALSMRPYAFPVRLGYSAKLIEERWQLRKMLSGDCPLPPIRPCWEFGMAQLKMMRSRFPALANATLLPYSASHADGMRLAKTELPGKLFVFDNADEMRRAIHPVPQGVFGRVGYVAHAGFVTLPRAICARMSSLFDVGKETGRSNVQ